MAEPRTNTVRIDDPRFRQAVDLIDAGDADALRQHLDRHPDLLTARAEEDGTYAGAYFRRPFLLWFIAENPIRNGRLPRNIVEVADTIIDAAGRHGVADLREPLTYTLMLVCSGCVARECGVQAAPAAALVEAGADPDAVMPAALAHQEPDAARTLMELGAALDLTAAAALGDRARIEALFDAADEPQRHRALALAATNGRAAAVAWLVDRGVDPNRHNPEGCHPHATPLHIAVANGHADVVDTLLARGADLTIRDGRWQGTPLEWADHCNQPAIADRLRGRNDGPPR